ncbi:hypothetical protein Ancab_012153 [Ancistrocladus abbreviatus]
MLLRNSIQKTRSFFQKIFHLVGARSPRDTENVMKESRMLQRMNDANYHSGRSMKISDKATVKNMREAAKNEGRRGEASLKTGNAWSSLDVKEALYYYSRLTCPVYLDIFHKFFMDM